MAAATTEASRPAGSRVVTSLGVPHETFAALLPENPRIRFFESRKRGHVRCELTPERSCTDLRALHDVRDRQAPVLASFVIESGRPGAQRA